MTTLYQLHSSMDRLRSSVSEIALTWRTGDSIILLGSTLAFIEWLNAYLDESDIEGIKGIYALAKDVDELDGNTIAKLNLQARLSAILTDDEWVIMTQDVKFNKVVTICL